MAKKNNREPLVEEKFDIKADTEVKEEVEPKKVEIPKPATKTGKVIDCERLNVRKGPSTDYEVVSVLKVGTVIEIEKVPETKEWYKTNDGYVMAKYIKKF